MWAGLRPVGRRIDSAAKPWSPGFLEKMVLEIIEVFFGKRHIFPKIGGFAAESRIEI